MKFLNPRLACALCGSIESLHSYDGKRICDDATSCMYRYEITFHGQLWMDRWEFAK